MKPIFIPGYNPPIPSFTKGEQELLQRMAVIPGTQSGIPDTSLSKAERKDMLTLVRKGLVRNYVYLWQIVPECKKSIRNALKG